MQCLIDPILMDPLFDEDSNAESESVYERILRETSIQPKRGVEA